MPTTKEQQRNELHKTIWSIADAAVVPVRYAVYPVPLPVLLERFWRGFGEGQKAAFGTNRDVVPPRQPSSYRELEGSTPYTHLIGKATGVTHAQKTVGAPYCGDFAARSNGEYNYQQL